MSVMRRGSVTSRTCSTSPAGDTINSIAFVIVGSEANIGRGTSGDNIFGGVTPESSAEYTDVSGPAAGALDGADGTSGTVTGTAAKRRVARCGAAEAMPLGGAGLGGLEAPARVPVCLRDVTTVRTRAEEDVLADVAAAAEDACVAGAVGDWAAGAAAACAGARWPRMDRMRMRPPATAPITTSAITTAATTNAAGRIRRICARIRATDPSGRKSSMPSSIGSESRPVLRAKGASG